MRIGLGGPAVPLDQRLISSVDEQRDGYAHSSQEEQGPNIANLQQSPAGGMQGGQDKKRDEEDQVRHVEYTGLTSMVVWVPEDGGGRHQGPAGHERLLKGGDVPGRSDELRDETGSDDRGEADRAHEVRRLFGGGAGVTDDQGAKEDVQPERKDRDPDEPHRTTRPRRLGWSWAALKALFTLHGVKTTSERATRPPSRQLISVPPRRIEHRPRRCQGQPAVGRGGRPSH